MSAGTPNYITDSVIASLQRLIDFNSVYRDDMVVISAETLSRAITQLQRLSQLEKDLNHELTDEECEKLYKGLMEGEIHER